MIAFLEGTVAEKAAGRLVISVGGVGYELSVPASVLSSLPPVGAVARVHTRMVVREDAIALYGFTSTDERALFDQLTSVAGVGPKVAVAFLSSMTPDAIRHAVVTGDVVALTVVPGVGRKVAQRVILDLRDKLGGGGDAPAEGPLSDVRDALLALGLTAAEASEAMRDLPLDGKATEDLLREALQKVGR